MANVVLWILQILAGGLFVLSGLTKVIQSKEKLAPTAPWVEDFSAAQVRLIGLAELLGSLGLILPGLTGILPVLTPIAATCLVVIMAGAVYTQFRGKETKGLILPMVALLVSLLVAIGRFWISPL
jgi:uncharacterized membrane protein YphA (DoxX/SURF4 family)